GSGKTEVYLSCIAACLEQGRQAIMLIPEISLTPQNVHRFRARFGDRIAVLHSGLSAGERFDEWRRIRFGLADVVIGARSAVFAPVQRLGLIIIDEEHENSYISEISPRYNAIEVASYRCRSASVPLLLGSATPSLLSYYRACSGRYRLLTMPERIMKRPLPEVEVIDMREEFLQGNNGIYSKRLLSLLTECLDNGKQAILIFVYKDGYYQLYAPEMFKSIIKGYIADYDRSIVKMKDVDETYKHLITDLNYVRQSELNANESLINFKNTLLAVKPDSLVTVPHSSSIYSTIQIPCNWTGKDSPTPIFDAYLSRLCNYNKEVENLCLQIIGVCISNVKGYRMKKAPFFYGDGNTGKSQLKALVERLLGEGNYVGIDLQEIESRFGTGVIYGMRLSGSSDMSFLSVEELKTFKKITGGDSLFAEFKGQQGFEYTYNGMLWFCMNRLPKFGGDDGQWVYDRIMPISCVNVIPAAEQDKCLLDKMYAEREGIVYKAVKALQTVIANGYRFSEPQIITEDRTKYFNENNSVITFYQECLVEGRRDEFSFETVNRIYNVYKEWCKDNNNG
ncbi:MAG: primosomal protein N', partial [Parasporobacterium sp.]|nr:primosomal protein N' [Parasporobacterium sp.]